MEILSVVVPCYNEEESLRFFYDAINNVMTEINQEWAVLFEIIFINDGSTDKTLDVIKSFASYDDKIRYISFSRNFGKEAAIYAGLKASRGDYVVLIDADLQHPPENIREMYSILKQEDYDSVAYRRTLRKGEPKVRSFFARLFYKFINKISDVEIVDGATDFRMMRRYVVDSVLQLHEYNRFTKGIFSWVGYRTKWLEYISCERVAGETKWSMWKLMKYALEGIVGFSTAPLSVASFVGFTCFILSLLWILFIVVKTVIFGDPAQGFPTLACMILMMGGIQLLCMGVLGQYLARTYLETKNRPVYVVQEEK